MTSSDIVLPHHRTRAGPEGRQRVLTASRARKAGFCLPFKVSAV
jgi:hypothetical protein